MHQALPVIVLALLAPLALARPHVGTVSELPSSTPSCRVYLVSQQNAREARPILYWSGKAAHMQVDGHALFLTSRELPCHSSCVRPGTSGYRVFQFSSNETQITLRKRVSCARDSEACAGLPVGPAQLVVRSSAGTAQLRVRTDYCDL